MDKNKGTAVSAGKWWSSEKKIVLLIIAGALVVVGCLVGVMTFSRGIRAYRNQIRFLDESWMCVAEHQDTTVVLAGDNHRKLISLLDRCSRKAVSEKPKVTDSVFLTFKKDGVHWEMEISQTDQECLKLDLIGEDEYHMYISEEHYFKTIAELVSPEGKGTPNKTFVPAE